MPQSKDNNKSNNNKKELMMIDRQIYVTISIDISLLLFFMLL